MTFEEYRKYDALALADLVKKKEVTPSELLDIAIKRTEEVNPKINAVVTKLYDEGKQFLKSTDINAPFSGVPFLLKDVDTQLKGTRFTAGSAILKDNISTENSEVVNRIQKAGLVIFGKSNTSEFGLTPFVEGKYLGVCRNPWNTNHTSGGSSGGAGSSVAAGIIPMAFASDGGGSIRIPASCNGLFGIKPSRGRITNGPFWGEVWSGAVSTGIISRSVRDAAAYIDAVQGEFKGDPYIIASPVRPYSEEIKLNPRKLKIGYSYKMPQGLNTPVDEENIKAIEKTVSLLRSAGHILEEVPLPFTHQLNAELLYMLVVGEASANIEFIGEQRGRKPQRDEVEPNTWLLYKLGKSFSANNYALARLKWSLVNRKMADFHKNYDLLLTPTVGRKPFVIGTMNNTRFEDAALKTLNALGLSSLVRYTGMIEKIAEKTFSWMPYPAIANLTGQPSMSVPLHWSSDNLPVGVMFTAPINDEATLFQLAAQLENEQPWFNKVAGI